VPNCVWRALSEPDDVQLDYPRAAATVRGLNQQVMDQAEKTWYVVVAIENEPLSQTTTTEPSGAATTVSLQRLHVVRPGEGGGKGDCSYCPAHTLSCAAGDAADEVHTLSTTVRRGRPD
jgi:hypothetical protein